MNYSDLADALIEATTQASESGMTSDAIVLALMQGALSISDNGVPGGVDSKWFANTAIECYGLLRAAQNMRPMQSGGNA